MERYGHVLVKAFTERADGPGLEAVLVNYKALHHQASSFCLSAFVVIVMTRTHDKHTAAVLPVALNV